MEVNEELYEAVRTSNHDKVIALIQAGANPNAFGKNGEAIASVARFFGDTKIFPLLVSLGMDVDARHPEGFTLLARAAATRQYNFVRYALAHGADVNAKQPRGETPFMIAALCADPEMIQLLADAGVDVYAKDDDGKTAIDYAMRHNHKETLDLLREIMILSPIEPGTTNEECGNTARQEHAMSF